MSSDFANSYLGKLRKFMGKNLLLAVGARCVIENSKGQILLVLRREKGLWGLPAGAAEPGESITQCVMREVYEEVGVTVQQVVPFGFASEPSTEFFTYDNGDQIHGYSLLLKAESWVGEIGVRDAELKEVRFFSIDQLPESRNCFANEMKTLDAYREFQRTGRFQLY